MTLSVCVFFVVCVPVYLLSVCLSVCCLSVCLFVGCLSVCCLSGLKEGVDLVAVIYSITNFFFSNQII